MNHINRGLTFTGFKVISVFGGETRCLLCLRAPPLDVFPESLMNHAHFPSCTVNKVLSPTPRSFWMLVCPSLCHTQYSGAPYWRQSIQPTATILSSTHDVSSVYGTLRSHPLRDENTRHTQIQSQPPPGQPMAGEGRTEGQASTTEKLLARRIHPWWWGRARWWWLIQHLG